LGIFAYQKAIVRLVIGLFLYGGLIEILQWLSGWRSGEFADWLADGTGIFLGGIFMNILVKNSARLLKY